MGPIRAATRRRTYQEDGHAIPRPSLLQEPLDVRTGSPSTFAQKTEDDRSLKGNAASAASGTTRGRRRDERVPRQTEGL
eukprot:6217150-Pyramimonas_sp.AAC.1